MNLCVVEMKLNIGTYLKYNEQKGEIGRNMQKCNWKIQNLLQSPFPPYRLKHRYHKYSHDLNNHTAKHGYGHGDHDVGAFTG